MHEHKSYEKMLSKNAGYKVRCGLILTIKRYRSIEETEWDR